MYLVLKLIPIPPLQNENGPDESRSDVLKFSTGSPPQAKRIWRNAVEQHTFFRYVWNVQLEVSCNHRKLRNFDGNLVLSNHVVT